MRADNTVDVLAGLARQDTEAERQVFEQYFHALVELARKRLPRRYSKARDEWDIAQSTMKSLFRRCALGAYPDLRDHDSLWAVLATILNRKIANSVEFERARCRDQRQTVSISDSDVYDVSDEGGAAIQESISAGSMQNSSGDADLLIEYVEQGLSLLTPRQRRIASLILEGMNPHEVSKTLEVTPSTVYRTLDRIGEVWKERLGE